MRNITAIVLSTLALTACPIGSRPPDAGTGEDAGSGAIEPCGDFQIPAGRIDTSKPWPGLSCSDYPQLCNLHVESTVNEPDTAKAIDIAFVGDGFTDLAAYQSQVKQLIDGATAATGGPVARRPKLYNFHRVDLVSTSSNDGNADRTDTALAGCIDIAGSGNLVVDDRLAGLAGTANVKDVDVIVVILNTEAGSPNSTLGPLSDRPAIVRLNPLASAETFMHELGHAVFHLGDEYGTEPACFTPPDLPAFTTADYLYDVANLSTESTGAKWADAYAGAVVGGMDFLYCVYHPGPPCLMNEGSLPYCPVCAGAVDRTLDAREGKDDGPPRCGLELAALTPTYVYGTFEARVVVFDRNYPSQWTLKLDDAQIAQGAVAFWYGRTPSSIDSSKLSNGTHTLSVECRDALGTTATAHVDLTVRN